MATGPQCGHGDENNPLFMTLLFVFLSPNCRMGQTLREFNRAQDGAVRRDVDRSNRLASAGSGADC